MALQDALASIREYNAAMELPYSALLGIGAFLGAPSDINNDLVRQELEACAALCRGVEATLGQTIDASSEFVYLSAALKRVCKSDRELQDTLSLVRSAREVADILIRRLSGEEVSGPSQEQLKDLTDRLRQLADRIKQEIPRDSYLASLSGNTPTRPVPR